MRSLAILMSGLLLISCTQAHQNAIDVSKATPAEQQASLDMTVVPVGFPKPSKVAYVGPVSSSSCQMAFDKPATEAHALAQLKIVTVRLGANAILDYSCERVSGSNCGSEVVCSGTAAKI